MTEETVAVPMEVAKPDDEKENSDLSNTNNYEACCRLCLCDEAEALQSVFDHKENNEENAVQPTGMLLHQQIMTFVAIKMTNKDVLPRLICKKCLEKLNDWQSYRNECTANQEKLKDWFKQNKPEELELEEETTQNELLVANGEVLELSLEEATSEPAEKPCNGDDKELNKDVDTVEEKQEEEASGKEPLEEDSIASESEHKSAPSTPKKKPINGLPEPVCQIKEEPMDTEGEEGVLSEHHELPLKTELVEEDYEFPPPLTHYNEEDDDSQNSMTSDSCDPRQCRTCFKSFSTASNRKKHERLQHKSPPPPVEEPPTAEQLKIQFAAGLKLLQTNETPIAFEPLSKIELSYIEKCKSMVSMYQTMECACHKVVHPNLKGLLSHLRSLRIWFPVFTCYNCMITYSDRSSFTRHNFRCRRASTEGLITLSNLRKRSEVKIRLYQNFKCTECNFLYTFHNDYLQHVNEEHVPQEPPFICPCGRSFHDVSDYKAHVYATCLVEFYCDICFVTTKSLDEFKKHAVENHDSSEGFVLFQDDNYKLSTRSRTSEVDTNGTEVMYSKRRSSFYNKMLDGDGSTPTSTPPPTRRLLNPAVSSTKKKRPTKCHICPKIYSNYANMMRHYKTHSGEDDYDSALNETGNSSFGMDEAGDEAMYSCPDCGGMYDTTTWQKHLVENHEEKPCNQCDKTFRFQTELDQHRSVHLNLKVYRDSKTKSYKSTMLSPKTNVEIIHICEQCKMTFNSKDELENHKLDHEGGAHFLASDFVEVKKEEGNDYECVECNMVFPGYRAMWEHDKQFHPEKRTPQSKEFPKACKYCDKVLYTGGSYFMHKQMHERALAKESAPAGQPSRPSLRRGTKNDDDDESYHTCRKCFKVFSSSSNLRKHMVTHGIHLLPTHKLKPAKKVWCENCHVACDSIEDLARHKLEERCMEDINNMGDEAMEEDVKPIPTMFSCDMCPATFIYHVAMNRHKDKRHGHVSTRIICKFCQEMFDTVALLNKHISQYHVEKTQRQSASYRCDLCPKVFATFSALFTHQGWHRRNTDGKPGKVLKPDLNSSIYQCSTCMAELPNNTALQIHILEKHRNVDAIVLTPRCVPCKQDFKNQEEYDNHKRLHEFLDRQQESVEVTPVIKKKTAHSSKDLVRPFSCKYCNSSFTRADNLSFHVRQLHKDVMGVGKLQCTQCDRTFERQQSLVIHMKVHGRQKQQTSGQAALPISSPNGKYSCSICSLAFNLPKDLRSHTIRAHPF